MIRRFDSIDSRSWSTLDSTLCIRDILTEYSALSYSEEGSLAGWRPRDIYINIDARARVQCRYIQKPTVSVIYVEQTLGLYGDRTTADKERARYLRP